MATNYNYTVDDFVARLKASPYADQMSEFDVNLGYKNPAAGISLLEDKRIYNEGDATQKKQANESANLTRQNAGGYYGGSDGSLYTYLGQQPQDYVSDPAPVRDTTYEKKSDGVYDKLMNRDDFQYNYLTDPVWQAYQTQYQREGDRAYNKAMSQSAARTGGVASTAAQSAASQAQAIYNQQLTDKIPELYQQAYERYLKDYEMMRNDLTDTQSMQDMMNRGYSYDYTQYNDNRNFDYGRHMDQISYTNYLREMKNAEEQQALENQREADKIAYEQQIDERDYSYKVKQDTLAQKNYENEIAYQKQQDALTQKNYENEQAYQRYLDALKTMASSSGSSSGYTGGSSGGASSSRTSSGGGNDNTAFSPSSTELSAAEKYAKQYTTEYDDLIAEVADSGLNADWEILKPYEWYLARLEAQSNGEDVSEYGKTYSAYVKMVKEALADAVKKDKAAAKKTAASNNGVAWDSAYNGSGKTKNTMINQ